ncbi:MAG: PEP-CTERM sorting domain-containing protein [Pirellula sp.]
MKRFKVVLTCLALTAMSCVNAMAGTWLANNRAGSVSGSFDAIIPTTGDLTVPLSVTNFHYNSAASSRLGAFAGIAEPGELVWVTTQGFDALGSTIGDAYTFTSASFGVFNGVVSADTSFNAGASTGSGNRTLDLKGTFTPGSNAHYEGDTLTLAGTTLQIAFSRNDGGSVNASWSFDTTSASEVPEPTSMAIFSLGALGFAYRNRRRIMK